MIRGVRLSLGVVLLLAASGCKSVPATPASLPPPAPSVALDRKMGWILRLEQARTLRDDAAGRPAAATSATAATGPVFVPATTPDLDALVRDPEAAVRARAALAIGRVGGAEGAASLVAALADPDEYVRANAAFGLGLLGAVGAVSPLTGALQDPSVMVRGRAVEALGLVAQPSAASAIADAAGNCRDVIGAITPDDEEWPKSPEIELCRLSLFALVRLKQFDALAKVALDPQGQPVSQWWPVAYALQRINDKRAVPALVTLASSSGVVTRAFALRGLAAAGDAGAAPIALATVLRREEDVRLRVAAARALAIVGDAAAVRRLLPLVADRATPPNLAVEIVAAVGARGDAQVFDTLLDLWTNPWPTMRAAAMAAAAKVNPDAFLFVISSVDHDRDWSVRAALASVFATLPADRVRGAIAELVDDPDVRVRGAALDALAKVGAPDLDARLVAALGTADFAVRATAARLIGEKKPAAGADALVAAYARGQSDATYAARAAVIRALAAYGAAAARPTLQQALADKDWPVRLKAADLLHTLGDAAATPTLPAPIRQPGDFFESAALLHPQFSPHAFIDTRRGTIELELDVVQSPFTTQTFIDLARAGFFTGVKVHRLVPNFVIQTGDPRGDGEGGPGFAIRDELSGQPFLRGTVGIALDGRDTGGSQFFITVSPQPHLDGKYTVFGHVVRGAELLDVIAQWDVIDAVRIWDGISDK